MYVHWITGPLLADSEVMSLSVEDLAINMFSSAKFIFQRTVINTRLNASINYSQIFLARTKKARISSRIFLATIQLGVLKTFVVFSSSTAQRCFTIIVKKKIIQMSYRWRLL